MIRLVRAELLKITTARLGVAMFVLGMVLGLVGTGFSLAFAGREVEGQIVIDAIDTVADTRELVYGAAQIALFALLLGATSTTTEHRYGTIGGTFLLTPVRSRVVVAKVVAAAAVGLLFGLAGRSRPSRSRGCGSRPRATCFRSTPASGQRSLASASSR